MRHFVLHFVFDYVLFTKSENSRYAGSIFLTSLNVVFS